MAKIIAFVEYDQVVKRTDSHTQYMDYIEGETKQQKRQELKWIVSQEKEWQELCRQMMKHKKKPLTFADYLRYMRRSTVTDQEEFKKKKVLATENGYETLSGQEGMFDGCRDVITPKQRTFYQHRFQEAYAENAILWKPIISFEQGFLEEIGVIENHVVSEEKLKQATRQAVENFIKNNELPAMHWTGMIHYDTDNVHIHVAMVEKNPTNVINWTQDEIKEFARCSPASFEAIKRDMATHLVDRSQQKKELTQHIRQHLIQPTRELDVIKEFPSQSNDLMNKLSTYQYGKLKPYEKAWLNALTTQVLHSKFHSEFQEFRQLVKKENEYYQALYGMRKHERSDYATNLERDVYYRIGNAILKQLQVEKLKTKGHDEGLSSNQSQKSSDLTLAIYQLTYVNQKLKRDLERASQKAQSKHEQLIAQIQYQHQLQERGQSYGGYSLSI